MSSLRGFSTDSQEVAERGIMFGSSRNVSIQAAAAATAPAAAAADPSGSESRASAAAATAFHVCWDHDYARRHDPAVPARSIAVSAIASASGHGALSSPPPSGTTSIRAAAAAAAATTDAGPATLVCCNSAAHCDYHATFDDQRGHRELGALGDEGGEGESRTESPRDGLASDWGRDPSLAESAVPRHDRLWSARVDASIAESIPCWEDIPDQHFLCVGHCIDCIGPYIDYKNAAHLYIRTTMLAPHANPFRLQNAFRAWANRCEYSSTLPFGMCAEILFFSLGFAVDWRIRHIRDHHSTWLSEPSEPLDALFHQLNLPRTPFRHLRDCYYQLEWATMADRL